MVHGMNVYNIFQPRDGHLKEFLCIARLCAVPTRKELKALVGVREIPVHKID